MDTRSNSFYICLVIHCFIYYGEAASDDQHEAPMKKKKWTTDEENDLIFFDVSTDTGRHNHFDRIRTMWREVYPHSNVTDSSLRRKLYRLREESLEEGELKKNFKWNENLERELLNVYYNITPFNEEASLQLEKQWKRRHPDYQFSSRCLLLRVEKLLKENKYPEYERRRRAIRDDESEELGGKIRHKWTAEWNDKLRTLDELTNTGEPYQFERIKSKWFEEYPDSNVTESALQAQLRRLRRETQEEEGRSKYFRWSGESERELLDIYLNTYPYRENVNITLEAEWNSRHQGYGVSRKYLVNRARAIMKKNKYPKFRTQGECNKSSTMDFQWDNYHHSELMHIRKIAGPERGYDLRKTHRIWSELHPEYSHVTPEDLKERLFHLKRNPPNGDFPWTQEENQELLEIYDETMPQREDQGQRIYDIWFRRHPRYSFMTPYYLQVHASTLARQREIEAYGKCSKTKWTDKEKADLVDMVHQFPRRRLDDLQAFHEEWVRTHPRLAYKTNSELLFMTKRFMSKGIAPSSVESGGELKRQSRNCYTPSMKRELLNMYHRTFPKTLGHATRLKKEWENKCNDIAPIKAKSLKQIVQNWEERGPDKRADKAPMVYSFDEAGSSSVPGISGDSD